MAASNPGAASVSTQNFSPLRGQAITSDLYYDPTPDLLANQTTIYQTPDGQLWKSNGTALISIVDSIDASSLVTYAALSSSNAMLLVSAQDRASQYGNMPAANASVQSGPYAGMTVEAALTAINVALSTPGASAPANTVQPAAATGTATVGSLQTASTGTWTGASTYLYRWYQQNATTGARTLIPGATSSTYTAQSADYGFKLIYDVAGVSATPGIPVSGYVFASAATSTIGSTLATNTGAVPSITGSAVAGSTLSLAMGGWTGAANGWSAQWYVGGVAYGSPTAISLTTPITFVTDNTMVSKSVGAIVFGYNAFNVPSASPGITATGSVTVTGAVPAVANTVPPAWPATVYLEVQATLTPGTWTGTINTGTGSRVYDFYRNGTAAGNLVRAGNTIALFTPRASEGVLVGDTLYMIEKVTETATGTVFQQVSAGKTVTATPATLTAATANTGLSWTAGTAISAVIPVTATGGTTPYTYSVSPALPSGVSLNSTTGQLTGTPTSASSLTTYTITVTDAVAATSPATFTASVAAAGASPLGLAGLPVVTELAPYSIGFYNGTSTITQGGNVLRQYVADPGASGINTHLYRIMRSDWAVGPRNVRNEDLWIDYSPTRALLPGTDYWFAFAVRPKSGEWPITAGALGDEEAIIMQTHSQSSGDTQPDVALYVIVETGQLQWRRSWSAQVPNIATNGANQTKDGQTTEYSFSMAQTDKWIKCIVHYRPGWLTSHAPALEIWQSIDHGAYSKVVNRVASTDFNTYNSLNGATQVFPGSYPRYGFYKWSGTGWNANYASMACYYSDFYYGTGTNLYANAEAAMAGL